MLYYLSKTEINQIKTLELSVAEYYEATAAKQLLGIFKKCILNGYVDESDVYELLEILPKIIPQRQNQKLTEDIKQKSFDWQEYIDKKQYVFRREVEKLYQSLSKWIFLHNAVYRKNMDVEECSVKKHSVDDNVNAMK